MDVGNFGRYAKICAVRYRCVPIDIDIINYAICSTDQYVSVDHGDDSNPYMTTEMCNLLHEALIIGDYGL